MEMELFSCYCLFEACCPSKIKNETFKQLDERVASVMNRRYEHKVKGGLFTCSHCRPAKYRNRSCWLLRTAYAMGIPQKRYAACKDHVERIMDNITLTLCQKMNVSEGCGLKENFTKRFTDEYRSCLYLYHEDLIILSDFCLHCKIYFASLTDFRLKRVKIDRNGICSTASMGR